MRFSPKHFLAGLAIAAVVAGALTLFTGLSFWLTLPGVIGAMLINAWLADVEDNRPGGFNNPSP